MLKTDQTMGIFIIIRISHTQKKNAAVRCILKGRVYEKVLFVSNEVMSGGTSFDEISISINCVHLVS